MRAGMGLSTPERRIGQAAHDFQQLSGQAEVIYTRSLRSGNAPTVASRWLQRLMVVAGEGESARMRAAGGRYIALAKAADGSAAKAGRVARPNPKPPVEMRPAGLSVTEIETWIRDPYAIHARHVLDLHPLPPLERKADPMLRGQIYHQILAKFVMGAAGPREDTRMEAIARAVFEEYNVPKEVAATWLPRFMAIARLFVTWEDGRRGNIASSHCEISGRIEVDGFRLRGRADRIDILAGGNLSIIDYKTGMKPSTKQARSLSPQLALEGKMAMLGAFGALHEKPVAELLYVRLRAGEVLKVDDICGGKDPVDPAELIDGAWEQLQGLITGFRNRDQGYLSRRAPSHEGDLDGDYDHLARVREWASGEEGSGDE
jgi:ATP-dependent helicase/nuclease subunit B